MDNEAFVYRWDNLSSGKCYIGYHKGSLDDGYICSSKNKEFWDDFNNSEYIWRRVILFVGSKNDCLKYEQSILKEIDIKSDIYYNNARGAEIIFSNAVIEKMSQSAKNRWDSMDDTTKKTRSEKISKAKLGVKRPKEVGEKLSKLYKGKSFLDKFGKEKAIEVSKKISLANTGKHIHSEEHKKFLSNKLKGNNYGKLQTKETREKKKSKFLENNPGKNKSRETREKISSSLKGKPSKTKGIPRKKVVCPYCKKEGGEGLMQRWHFENCKNK